MLGIRVLGDPVLRQMTTPVTDFGPGLQQLIDDMFETMHAAHGVGLAAPQVGRTERLAVAEVKDVPYVFINPEIIEREGKLKWEEGCLSIPELYGDVMRSKRVVHWTTWSALIYHPYFGRKSAVAFLLVACKARLYA